MLRRGLLGFLIPILTGCTGCGAITGTDYFADAVPFKPDSSFARRWREVEDCSGLRGDFAAVRWYRTPRDIGGSARADYRARRVVVIDEVLDASCTAERATGCYFTLNIIGHEALHLLERKGHGTQHSALFSKNGACRGLIATVD